MANSLLWKSGAALIASSASAGAFGSHALKERLSAAGRLEAWHTASNYGIMNGLALLAISLHPRFGGHLWIGKSIAIGAAIFSFTIYGLILKPKQLGKVLGPLTPLGGMGFIVGYAAMVFL